MQDLGICPKAFSNLEYMVNFGERRVHKDIAFDQSTCVSFRKGNSTSAPSYNRVLEGLR